MLRSVFGTLRDPGEGDLPNGGRPPTPGGFTVNPALSSPGTVQAPPGGTPIIPGQPAGAPAAVPPTLSSPAGAPSGEGTPPEAQPNPGTSNPSLGVLPPPLPGNSIIPGSFVSPADGVSALPFRSPGFASGRGVTFGHNTPFDTSTPSTSSGIEDLLKRLLGK